jgi:predicted deacylase
MNNIDYFPRNYSDSREKFIGLGKRHLHATQTSFLVPSSTDNDLFVDALWLPPRKTTKNIFVISSGVHGSEAYTGSAVQQMLLSEFSGHHDNSGILFIHAVNPYGFKHHTRNTQNHVNMNRNFIYDEQLFKLRRPSLEGLQDFVEPRLPVSSDKALLLEKMRMQDSQVYFDHLSMNELIKIICPGQFEDPKKLEFGGFAREPQTNFIIDLLKKYLPRFENIWLCDLHTGLGDRYKLHLLAGENPRAMNRHLFSQVYKADEDLALYEFTNNQTDGFYKTYGDFNSIFGFLSNDQQKVVAMTFEYGTLGHSKENQIDSLSRWLLEHQGSHYGFRSQEIKDHVLAALLEKFYPSETHWREQVIIKTREIFKRLFARAQAL